ncbi:MAG: hypothetical protein NUV98_02290 [Candidatus Roizmanbacteria bacterium]|nr:hypothetical protein [Candidatus Roizmanbacteria bacterium]
MESWVICNVARVVLGFKVFAGFVDNKPVFDDFGVVSFKDDKKFIQVMIFLSRTMAEEKIADIQKYYTGTESLTLYVAPLSTVIATGRAWR